MKIPVEKARLMAECQPGSGGRKYFGLPFDVVDNRDFDEKRWNMVMELVIKDDAGNLWRAFYERGLTESQYMQSFEYETEIEFKPVRRKVIEAYEYEEV